MVRVLPLLDQVEKLSSLRSLEGSSPPGLFVGRIGYPRVLMGPLAVGDRGDVGFMDSPEDWYGLNYRQIAELRVRLVRGIKPLDVKSARDPPEYLLRIHDMLLSRRSSSLELEFSRPPRATVLLVDEAPPFGPSGPIESMRALPGSSDRSAEKVYYDHDMRSEKAVIYLYERGFRISEIQRMFGAGMLGVKKDRKLVPTRWSITAIDDMISRSLIDEIKGYPTISEYRVYVESHLGNKFVIVLAPFRWSFEWMEAWYPGTTWNVSGSRPEVIGDHEGYGGRTTYAEEIGGCYYAARLAIAEALRAERRQAAVIAFREIYEDALFPVGVWLVRESLRRTMNVRPSMFDDARTAFDHAFKILKLPRDLWLSNSHLARALMGQRVLS